MSQKCLGSYPAKNVGDLTIFEHEIRRALRAQPGDRIVINSYPGIHRGSIEISVERSSIDKRRTAASWVVKDLHTFYPNKFRTRTEGDKTISTFWPNGYGTALSFEGVATRSPNDPYVHKIGKAIAELRAQKAYCDSIGAPFDDYELKMLTR